MPRQPVRGSCWNATAVFIIVAVVVVMLPDQVSSYRWIVGSNNGWTSNVDYIMWVQGKHFYLGDWLFFVYDRDMMNVVEVNGTDYETCNSNHPLHNWTTGAGRDIVPLNVTKDYYFINSKTNGLCNNGMKLAIHVENIPTPPRQNPKESLAPNRGGDTIDPPSSSPQKSPSGLPVPNRGRVGDTSKPVLYSSQKSPSGSPIPMERPESQKSGFPALLPGRIFITFVFAVGVSWEFISCSVVANAFP